MSVSVCVCVCRCALAAFDELFVLQFCVLFFFSLLIRRRQRRILSPSLICTSRKARCSFITLIFRRSSTNTNTNTQTNVQKPALSLTHSLSLFFKCKVRVPLLLLLVVGDDTLFGGACVVYLIFFVRTSVGLPKQRVD